MRPTRREQECRRPHVVPGIVLCFNEVSTSSGMSILAQTKVA